MRSQSKGIGSADISASTYDKIRTIPARLHCASHRRDNAPGELRPTATKTRNDHKAGAVGRPLHCLIGIQSCFQ